jgi:transposase
MIMPSMLSRLCRQCHRPAIAFVLLLSLSSYIAVVSRWDGVSEAGSSTFGRHNWSYIELEGVAVARKRKSDAKEAALAETRTLNPRPEAVGDEQFASSEFFDARDLVQVKYEMVRRVRVDGAAVTRTAAAFGFSRPSFYEAAAAVDRDGLGALVPAKPGPRRAHKLTGEVIAYVQQLREQDPGLGSARLADAIAEKFAIRVHPRSVERALARAEDSKSGDAQ